MSKNDLKKVIERAGKKVEMKSIRIYTDGAIRPEQGASGLAAIVRDETGQIRYWWSQKAGALTCNEAEYAAAIFAFEQLQQLPQHQSLLEIAVFSDSRVMVDQMSGRAAAHAPALRQAQSHLRVLTAGLRSVTFHHISREQNRLADALAYEAVSGLDEPRSKPAKECPHIETWDQILRLWRNI